MTETREQWIEREAREARARWGRPNDWEDLAESVRQDWRNVVALYYPEPMADAHTLRDLREIALKAYLAHPHAQDAGCMVDPMEAAVTAVLRAAKPYYSPRGNDLDLLCRAHGHDSRAFADYINSRIRYRFELPQPEPLRVPVDVEGLAKELALAYHRGVYRNALWAELGADAQEDYIREARAALAYLNIEPCDKPEYNPGDVAFRDALKKSQEIVKNWLPEQRNHNSIGYAGLQDNERAELENLRAECKRLRHEVEVERDRASDLLADKDSAEAEGGRLREEVANLLVEISKTNSKAERQRKQLHSQCKTIESRGAEIARLENEVKRLRTQQPEAQPVKVRFDVTAEDVATKIHHALHGGWPELSQESDRTKAVWIDTAKIAMNYLAAHAVTDAPAGVPSEWGEEDVEALAEAVRRAYWQDPSGGISDGWCDAARAALAWFDGKRGEV